MNTGFVILNTLQLLLLCDCVWQSYFNTYPETEFFYVQGLRTTGVATKFLYVSRNVIALIQEFG
ncbi:hypothetical protein [Aerosakkonema funiforme]|uniref:hypothetical protein n=1 Tax=Aerosakkonema funiforme TaxID=1246630 RepID=UPI0035BC931A